MENKEKDQLFGEIAIDLGYLNKEAVHAAVAKQETHNGTEHRKVIGEYLLEEHLLTAEQIDEILEIQSRTIRSTPQIIQE